MAVVNLLSTADAAERLGISVRRVNQLCQAENIGMLPSAKLRILEESDIEKLREILDGIDRKGWPRGEPRKKT